MEFDHTKLLNSQKILTRDNAVVMHKIYYGTAPATFFELFQKVSHTYPTEFSKLCYKIPETNLPKCKHGTSSRGVLIWNNFLSHSKKQIKSCSLFKTKVKL